MISRHDFLPFGEEVPAGTNGRDSNFGQDASISQKFTGQYRDPETNLDYFFARYLSAPQGRFLSPDPGNAGADPTDPQSWNGYSYVRNNPLTLVDPSGMSCVDGNGQIVSDGDGAATYDNGDGKGCSAVGVQPGDPNDPSTLNDGQVNAETTAQEPSIWEYWWTISTHQIPNYVENDVPLPSHAKQIFTRVGNMLPTFCGGGVYVYAGKEFDGGTVHGFAGAITEFDSREGISKGALFEGGAGEGLMGGGGYVATTNTKGQVSTSGLGYLGAGTHAVVAGGSAGGVVFPNGAGVYAEGSLFGRAAGIGVYTNITTKGTCDSGQ